MNRNSTRDREILALAVLCILAVLLIYLCLPGVAALSRGLFLT